MKSSKCSVTDRASSSLLREVVAVRLVDAFWVNSTANTTANGNDTTNNPATTRYRYRRVKGATSVRRLMAPFALVQTA